MIPCPECGAPECEERFHEFLALEYSQPSYGEVHHLTIAAYMLQHSSKRSREGWLAERHLLGSFLDGRETPEDFRRRSRCSLAGGRRAFKISSTRGLPLHGFRAWQRTVLDVRLEPVDAYRADITAWARVTLLDAQAIELENNGT